MDNEEVEGAARGAARLIGTFVTFKALLVIASSIAVVVGLVSLLGAAAQQDDQRGVSAIGLQIPPQALEAYQLAAETCEGLDWSILAGIGQKESKHGALYGGVLDENGDLHPPIFGVQLSGSGSGNNRDVYPIGQYLGMWGLQGPYEQAIGPMQFRPATLIWAQTDGNGDGVVDPQNIYDAAMTAAFYLCHQSGGAISDVSAAIRAYNDWDVYVEEVLQNAALYSTGGGEWSDEVQALLENPNICLAERARQDLEDGRVDPRLVAALSGAATQYEICIGWFISGHADCVRGTGTYPNCTMSNHAFGRAADITHVGGSGPAHIVNGDNDAARHLSDWWFDGSYTGITPDNLGSPWEDAFGFTDAGHKTHLHLAFFAAGAAGSNQNGTAPPRAPTPTPEPTAPKIFITDLYGPNGALGAVNPPETTDGNIFSEVFADAQSQGVTLPPPATSAPFGAVPANTNGSGPHEHAAGSEPVGATGGLVSPSMLQAAIDSRQLGQVIRLGAGEYGPVVVTGATPLVLVGPDRGTARFTNPGGAVMTFNGPSSVSISGVTVADGYQGIQATGANLVVQDSEFVAIEREGIEAHGGSATVVNSAFSEVGFGLVIHNGSAVVTNVSTTGVSGHPVWTHGASHLQVTNSVFLDSGYAAINAAGSATVVGSFIGDIDSGPAVMTSGPTTIVGNVMWANSGIAVFSTGDGSVMNNLLIDGAVYGSPVQAGNVSGLQARAVLPPQWMTGTSPTNESLQVVAGLVSQSGF